ncbi:MAG: hypothetical protein AB1801_00500 [Chloroflexota bacterium]
MPRTIAAGATLIMLIGWLILTSAPGLGAVEAISSGCPPIITFTQVPAYGSFANLTGRAACINPVDYKVVVYIFVSGWWIKPTFADPVTPIQPDGSWTTDITTGGVDETATGIVAFLIHKTYPPPPLGGAADLPIELYQESVAYTQVERTPRTLSFSGYVWYVKASETPVGPGDNYFSDSPDDVWVDVQGRLHLKIVQRDGRWYSTEVYTQASLGYGEYFFSLASPALQGDLDPNVVLGLFTWDGAAPPGVYNREIDIEVSRWGNEANSNNAQYVVQPYTITTHLYPFPLAWSGSESTHWFDWQANEVQFAGYKGHGPVFAPGDVLATWTYTGPDTLPDGPANARINLWLVEGNPPTDGQTVEVIITAFQFIKSWVYLPVIVR